ncbi:ABC transporter ATP-binding protein [Blastococcus capsensis]|uniref:ABC transporter ATP-binding protein n=1 Tax=Blastococcus capsensis TaxID=1564163 RepID=UPI00253F9629|nr:ABC transporter ATP-binding protein [Blastococcus capsensis]MDK3256147.1 ABC transporter ATP-binding protein [Blastococcus capsensis]
MGDIAVETSGVSKRFRLYHERNQSLKAAFMRGRRAKFEEFWALQDIDLQIPAGKTFGLIGHNGSGKSTLLKCLAGILVPDRGSIGVHGRVSALLELGAGFHPELSGRDNVYLNGSILGMSRKQIDRQFDEIVDFAGLETFIDTPVKNYSSGMYVRLGFSVAINVDPEILMVDEVLAVGDESFQRKCMEKFADFRAQGRTVIIVSHALGTMRSMCDEVAWLDHGKLQGVGRPSDLVDEYVGASHEDRTQAPGDSTSSGGSRWGSQEITLDGAELLCDGRVTSQVSTGADVTFRLRWTAPEPVAEPVFGMAIYSLEGVHVTGPNSQDVGLSTGTVHGSGHVDVHVPTLMLTPGTYQVTAAVLDSTGTHAFDHRDRMFRFDVTAGHPRDRYGVVSLGGSWDVAVDRAPVT